MRVALLVVLVAVVNVLLPTGSGADPSATEPLDRVVLTDPVGDAWTADDTSWTRSRAVGAPPIDVVRAVVAHRQHGIRLRMWFTDLRSAVDQSFTWTIRSPRASHVLTLTSGPGDPAGTAALTSDGIEIVCPGLTQEVDPEQERVSIRLPRPCLDRPRWIRASSSSSLWPSGFGTTAGSFVDNPHNTGFKPGRTVRLLWPGAAPPSPPRPSTVALDDPIGDVWTPARGYLPATEPTVADVVRAVVWHRVDRLVVRVQFADLQQSVGTQIVALLIAAETGDHYAGLEVGRRHPSGRHYLIGPLLGSATCPGFRHRIDLERDLMVLSIPRRCMGDPTWLRVTLDSYFYPAGHEFNGAEFVDNPHNNNWESGATPFLFAPLCVYV
jgi:hypothetical protein